MPVLQVITDNERRGAQVFAADLHTALERRGVSVRTVALAPGTSPARLDFESLGPSRRHPATLRALRAAIASSSAVVGHGSTTLPMCAVACLGLGVPFVYRQISDQRFWVNTAGRRVRTRVALRSTDHVVALWQGSAEVLQGDFGITSDRITIIPNGVPIERCPQIEPEGRRMGRMRFGLNPGKPTLLSIGALTPEKGVDTLVRSMGQPELHGWQLLVVGRGPEEQHLRDLARVVPNGSVIFHPPVSSGADAIAAADVIGLTSRGGDSMPAVLIEAGMMGVPAVATPVEGIVDIVLDGRTGHLVPVGDERRTAAAVASLASSGQDAGRAAREHCTRRFEITPVAQGWQDVLDRVRVS